MLDFRSIHSALRQLEIDRHTPVIVHSSLSAFGTLQGGAETMLGAILAAFDVVVMPVFTYFTMLIPEDGPASNGLVYGSGKYANRMAEVFHPAMPADRLMGIVPETLRKRAGAERSSHPILSFAGMNAGPILAAQTLEEPLAPLRLLYEQGGWVLLLGVNHTTNTSVHFAERLAGRKQFVRWALTPDGVVACPGFPGCSDGFNAIAPRLASAARFVSVGPARITAAPLSVLVDRVVQMLAADPLALLCQRDVCERCQEVRSQFAG